jgi:Tfp pilus assembly protein PilF
VLVLQDRYDNALSTGSAAARDAYVEGVDRFLAAGHGAEGAFGRAVEADPGFALAHVGLARVRQVQGRGADAAAAMAEARRVAAGPAVDGAGLSAREAAHLAAFDLLIGGRGPEAYRAIRAHAAQHPRDAMVVQTCTGVFGLIGFCGQPGREAEQLAFTAALAPHYGDDWWFLGQHAFSQVEAGQIGPAGETVERALAGNPLNANAAHIKGHVEYEAGETDAGYAYLTDWQRGYDREGQLHCHIAWHVAIWALERGDIETMWRVVDEAVAPGGAWGPPLNVMTDTAAILYRAELAGVQVPAARWRAVSDYAARMFPKPGIAFADVHAALAHAMAGNDEALERIIDGAAGPAGELVRTLAAGFRALAAEDWGQGAAHLARAACDHARIGGSRAQRDLIEYALLGALLKQGKADEARRLLALRRPLKAAAHAVHGL